MTTEAEKAAHNRYQKKLKQISFRFSMREEKLYHDFMDKCRQRNLRPITVIKTLIEEWTYIRI